MAGVITRSRGRADSTTSQTGTIHLNSTDGVPEARVEGVIGTARWGAMNVGPQGGVRLFEDFILDAGATLPLPWGKQDTSAAGAPTTDFVADADGGHYNLALATTNEVETLTLYTADQLVFDVTKKPIISGRISITPDVTGATGFLAATDKIVFGIAAARNATLDSNATHAWFLLTGASNLNIYWETDDGTTDDDDNDSGVDYVSGTFFDWKIDLSDLTAVKFYINEVLVASASMAAATGNLQPYVEVQKAAATNFDHKVLVDWIDVRSGR